MDGSDFVEAVAMRWEHALGASRRRDCDRQWTRPKTIDAAPRRGTRRRGLVVSSAPQSALPARSWTRSASISPVCVCPFFFWKALIAVRVLGVSCPSIGPA